jgi:DNA-binding MarR family transcriptional regulator
MNEDEKKTIDKIVDNLFYISPLVSKAFKHSVRKNTNLNPVSFFVLHLLGHHEILTMSEIGCKLQMPKPHVTAQIDKLIDDNMVERIYDSNDRRIIKVKLSEKGKEDLKKISHDVGVEIRQRIQSLDTQKLKLMLDSSQQLRDILYEIMNDFH